MAAVGGAVMVGLACCGRLLLVVVVIPPAIHPTSSCSWAWGRVVCHSCVVVVVSLPRPLIPISTPRATGRGSGWWWLSLIPRRPIVYGCGHGGHGGLAFVLVIPSSCAACRSLCRPVPAVCRC